MLLLGNTTVRLLAVIIAQLIDCVFRDYRSLD